MRKIKLFGKLAVSTIIGAAFAFGATASMAADSSIVVGADTTFPPFETEVNGKVTGFDIDLIKAIAKAENLDVTFKTMSFNGIIPSLQAGTLDIAVAGITITAARMKNVDYSDAYYKSGLSVVVRKDSKINGYNDLKGHVVATRKATSSVDYLKDHGFNIKNLKQYKNIDSAYQALVTGGTDAVLFDNPVNLNFTLKHKNKAKIVGDLLTGEYYGIAVSKKHPELVDTMNKGLAKIRENGTYKKLFEKYFGGDMRGAVNKALKPADVAVSD